MWRRENDNSFGGRRHRERREREKMRSELAWGFKNQPKSFYRFLTGKDFSIQPWSSKTKLREVYKHTHAYAFSVRHTHTNTNSIM